MATGTDIFGYSRNPKPQGVFSASDSILKFGSATAGQGNSMLGFLIQSWNVSYQNNVLEIFELGSDSVYWVKGRPTGMGNIARIIGFQSVKLFPDEAWDACKGGVTMEIEAAPGKCPNYEVKKAQISMGGVIVVQVGFDANVANTSINEGLAFRFATMNVIDAAA